MFHHSSSSSSYPHDGRLLLLFAVPPTPHHTTPHHTTPHHTTPPIPFHSINSFRHSQKNRKKESDMARTPTNRNAGRENAGYKKEKDPATQKSTSLGERSKHTLLSKMSNKPKYIKHENGFIMPHGFPAHNFSNALSYEPESKDLFIATYPKCGTTLTQHLVYIMTNNGIPIQPHERLDQIFPHLEEVGGDYVRDSATIRGGKRLIKTHLPFDMTPHSTEAKYIYIARNPKDCVVSFYHHTRGFPQHYDFENGDFDVYFDLFCRGEVDFGNYFTTLRSWLDRRHDDNVLFITYEEIKRDKRIVIKKIASFIDGNNEDKELLTALEKSDDNENNNQGGGSLMEKVVFHSSLEEMKKDPLRWCSERQSHHTPFIRSGKVGGHKELITEEQEAKISTIMRNTFTQEELEFLGSKYY